MNEAQDSTPTSQANQELRSRIIGLEMIPWKELSFIQSDSFKTSTDEQYQKVASSLINNQFVAPFYVWRDESDGGQLWCVDGKRRDTVLRQIDAEGGANIKDPDSGQEEFYAITIPEELPALLIDAESKEAAAKLVLLFSSSYGEVSQEGLAEFIQQYDLNFPELKFEINLPEFSMPRFEQTFDSFGLSGSDNGENEPYPEEEEDFTPDEEKEEVVVERGDLFEINGRHRVICGDSLQEETFAKLFTDAPSLARLAITDPPYNIPYSSFGGSGKVQHENFAFANGEMNKNEFVEFLASYMRNLVKYSVDGSIAGHFMDFRHVWHVCQAADREDTYRTEEPKQICVWNKSVMANGSFYRAKHEFCLFFKSGTEKHVSHLQLKDRIRSNIWEYRSANDYGSEERREFGRLGALEAHPTPKPVKMIADAILDLTNEGEIVTDCFLGSGTALLAAERTNRNCYGVEYDPRYMQGILRRYINYCQNEGKSFEIKRNGKVMSEYELTPFMPITD